MRLQWGTLKLAYRVTAILLAKKKPKMTEGPFDTMSDRELDKWIKEWASQAPENFWMDGELHLSRPAAYNMYRKRWREMRPREQQDMLDSLKNPRSAAVSRVATRYLQAQEGEDVSPMEMLQELLAYLRAMHFLHWTTHWQVQGDPQYGDHLLFQRMYEAMPGEIDTLAEKLVGAFGPVAVDAPDQADRMAAEVRDLCEEGSDPLQRALDMEEALQSGLKDIFDALEDQDALPLGLNDFLASLANAHETNVYLLRQRTATTRGKTAGPVPVVRLNAGDQKTYLLYMKKNSAEVAVYLTMHNKDAQRLTRPGEGFLHVLGGRYNTKEAALSNATRDIANDMRVHPGRQIRLAGLLEWFFPRLDGRGQGGSSEGSVWQAITVQVEE